MTRTATRAVMRLRVRLTNHKLFVHSSEWLGEKKAVGEEGIEIWEPLDVVALRISKRRSMDASL